ncbi:glycosyl transferase [Thermogutta terrifontis]|uniref:Glycosyl transferase n=1 Tax=Thermogutta terrifontis TaxID=1331910 RepID=A0A286RG82_9BACT|nr:glycosyltransferase family 4 protein [Thermogutta terrifontis]ASV74966.1 glycosyl transferase [Thermogutta terrifontis]
MMSDNKTPVRVLHYFAFPGGGIGRYVHELLTRLRDQPEVEVELACIPSYHYLKQANYPTWPGLREITHPVPLRRRLRFAINLFVNPIRAIRRARLTGAQILHLSTIPHVTFALWSRKLKKAGLRLVVTAHDVRRSQGLICYPYEIEQLKRLYRACDALFVHSEYQKQDLINFAGVSPEKVHIVPHGPYYHGLPAGDKLTLRKRYGVPLDKQVALFFGDIRPDKNLDLFLQAMVPYKDRLFLVVAGQAKRSTSISQLRSLAEQLGLHDGVHVKWMTYYIPYEEVPNLFTLADWLALPYSRSFTSQSGVLNVAIAHNCPMLASALPTFREIFKKYQVGVLVPPDDVEHLREGIREIIQAIEGDRQWECERVAHEFSWERNVLTTKQCYLALASSAKPF